jgi:hypothetical protein
LIVRVGSAVTAPPPKQHRRQMEHGSGRDVGYVATPAQEALSEVFQACKSRRRAGRL